MELLFALFVVALFLNARAAFKLALDWKGMLTTLRFVRDAYARLDALPSEEALEREPRAPVFLHLVPWWARAIPTGAFTSWSSPRKRRSGRPIPAWA